MDENYTINEVVKRFKVSHQTVRYWIKSGQLVAFKVGDNLRVSESSIQAFIEKSSTKTT